MRKLIVAYLAAFVTFVALFVGIPAYMSGCTQSQVDQLQQQSQRLTNVRAATTQAITDAQAELDKLPAGDPVRDETQKKLKQLEADLAKVDQYLPKLQLAIKVLADGGGNLNDPQLHDAVRDIPYGPLVLAGILGVINIAQAVRGDQVKKGAAQLADDLETHQAALRQTVLGVEAALPSKTPEQKLQLAAAQDESTRALVTAIKGR